MFRLAFPLFALLAISGISVASAGVQATTLSNTHSSLSVAQDCTWSTGTDGAPRYEC